MAKCTICKKRWWFSSKVKCDCNPPRSISQHSSGYSSVPIGSNRTQPVSAPHEPNRVIEHLIVQTVVLDSYDSGNCHQIIQQDHSSSHSHSSCDSSSGYSSGDSSSSGSSYDSGSSSSSSWD